MKSSSHSFSATASWPLFTWPLGSYVAAVLCGYGLAALHLAARQLSATDIVAINTHRPGHYYINTHEHSSAMPTPSADGRRRRFLWFGRRRGLRPRRRRTAARVGRRPIVDAWLHVSSTSAPYRPSPTARLACGHGHASTRSDRLDGRFATACAACPTTMLTHISTHTAGRRQRQRTCVHDVGTQQLASAGGSFSVESGRRDWRYDQSPNGSYL